MERIINMLVSAAEALDGAIGSGHFKTAMILALTIISVVLLAAWLATIAISRSRQKAEQDPMVQHARRVSLFYLDRPLPAEIVLEHPDLRSRSEDLKQKYPSCPPQDLEAAVWEAEYNEFVAWELENELRSMKKSFPAASRRATRLAIREIADTRKHLPHGLTVLIKTRYWFPMELRYSLKDAHAWLDTTSTAKPPVPAEEKFRILKANKFRCAYCQSDWNDGVRLTIVKTRTGALVPACKKCVAEHDK